MNIFNLIYSFNYASLMIYGPSCKTEFKLYFVIYVMHVIDVGISTGYVTLLCSKFLCKFESKCFSYFEMNIYEVKFA